MSQCVQQSNATKIHSAHKKPKSWDCANSLPHLLPIQSYDNTMGWCVSNECPVQVYIVIWYLASFPGCCESLGMKHHLTRAPVPPDSSFSATGLELHCHLTRALVPPDSSSSATWLELQCHLTQAPVPPDSSSGATWLKLQCHLTPSSSFWPLAVCTNGYWQKTGGLGTELRDSNGK